MEWTIFVTIGSIVGLFFTVGKPIITLNSNIVKLTNKIESLEKYQYIQDKTIEKHDSMLTDHEKRITKLEDKV